MGSGENVHHHPPAPRQAVTSTSGPRRAHFRQVQNCRGTPRTLRASRSTWTLRPQKQDMLLVGGGQLVSEERQAELEPRTPIQTPSCKCQ